MTKQMKLLIFTGCSLVASALLFNGCKRGENDDTYTIKGKLLYSCEKPDPVSGAELYLGYNYGINNKYEEIGTTTNSDGSFEITYKDRSNLGELVIGGKKLNGTGSLEYLFGIPRWKDLNIGNLYAADNYTVYVVIQPKRATTAKDTLFYNMSAEVFKDYIVGPFAENQVMDTLVYRYAQFFDIENKEKYRHDGAFPLAAFIYKIGHNGKTQYASNESFLPCSDNNYYRLLIE